MKKLLALLPVLLLTGCFLQPKEMESGLQLRTRVVTSPGCSFSAAITADYGDRLHTFTLDCTADSEGTVSFTVSEPESIRGITGTLDGSTGALTFGDTVMAFPMLADGQVSPVSAPWIFLKTLRSGYITSAGKDGEGIRLSIDDSYEDDALHLDILLNSENQPTNAAIRYRERQILSVVIEDFKTEPNPAA